MTQVKNLFIVQNGYCRFNSLKLSNKGGKKMKKVSDFILSCTGKKEFTIIYDNNKQWLAESAVILPGTSFFVHRFESFTRLNDNAKKMIAFIGKKAEHENVILITSNSGVMDLINEFQKTNLEMQSFYKKLDKAKFSKLKSGRLSFVGIPNKRIKKGMKRIPSFFTKKEAKVA